MTTNTRIWTLFLQIASQTARIRSGVRYPKRIAYVRADSRQEAVAKLVRGDGCATTGPLCPLTILSGWSSGIGAYTIPHLGGYVWLDVIPAHQNDEDIDRALAIHTGTPQEAHDAIIDELHNLEGGK